MIHIIVNDLSFVGQAADEREAGLLLRDLSTALKALRTDLGTSKVHRPRGMMEARITAALPFGAFLNTAPLSRDERNLLLDQLMKGPYLGGPVGASSANITLPKHHCEYNGQVTSGSALAYAAYLCNGSPFFGTYWPAALLSLGNAPTFEPGNLVVHFTVESHLKAKKGKQGKRNKRNEGSDSEREIWNVTHEKQVAAVRRNYKANDGKHAADERLGGYVSPMDLKHDEARRVLADGVLLLDERRIFARHSGKYYIFPCHDHLKNEFHGFCVHEKDIQNRMGDSYAQLKRLGFFD